MRYSLRERGEGRWEVALSLGSDERGVRQRATFTVAGTRREAGREATKRLAAFDAGQALRQRSKLTVGAYLERWLVEYAAAGVRDGSLSAKTVQEYEGKIRCHLIPGLGGVELEKLTALQIDAFYNRMIQEGSAGGKGALSACSVLHLHRLLSAALAQAVRWGLLAANPCGGCKRRKVPTYKGAALEPAAVAVLLAAVAGTELELPVLLALGLGLRLGEVLALRWENVDLERRQVWVREALEDTRQFGVRVVPPKDREDRSIPLPRVAAEALVRQRGRQAGEKLALGPGYRDRGLVVARADGEYRRPKWLSDQFRFLMQKLARSSGLRPVRFHDLRHSYTSFLLAGRFPTTVVAAQLGHATTRQIDERYGHVLSGVEVAVADYMDTVFSEPQAVGK